jgi:hypothetical protein
MKEIFQQLQIEAVRIARQYPTPDFYRDFEEEVSRSCYFFISDARIRQILDHVVNNIENDFGHGIEHARKVALDAGVLILVEGARSGCSDEQLTQLLRLAQCAGLLHDICRKEKKHARAGAAEAKKVLLQYGFSDGDTADVCRAIANHEAFGDNLATGSREGDMISDSLYDADKFRWGPENFTQTIWFMVNYMDVSIDTFMKHYPKGMAFLRKIRETFRTPTGKTYGPQFIDLGVGIGEDLFEVIRTGYQNKAPF